MSDEKSAFRPGSEVSATAYRFNGMDVMICAKNHYELWNAIRVLGMKNNSEEKYGRLTIERAKSNATPEPSEPEKGGTK